VVRMERLRSFGVRQYPAANRPQRSLDGSHVLFWNGATLSTRPRPRHGHDCVELRELAKDLLAPGLGECCPPLPGYLPRRIRPHRGLTRYSPAGGLNPVLESASSLLLDLSKQTRLDAINFQPRRSGSA